MCIRDRTKAASNAALVQERINRNKDRVKVASGNKISLKGARFNVAGNALKVMAGVIVEFNYFNRYDVIPFREGDPKPPECYAYAAREIDMVPREDSPAPQHANCPDCSHNKWNKKINKKECRNKMRLAILPAGDPCLLYTSPSPRDRS